jgi:Ni,Fe-hydrogenase I cytochrome b subunit
MATMSLPAAQRSRKIQPLTVRITHWVNAIAMFIMIGSGWRIFN